MKERQRVVCTAGLVATMVGGLFANLGIPKKAWPDTPTPEYTVGTTQPAWNTTRPPYGNEHVVYRGTEPAKLVATRILLPTEMRLIYITRTITPERRNTVTPEPKSLEDLIR